MFHPMISSLILLIWKHCILCGWIISHANRQCLKWTQGVDSSVKYFSQSLSGVSSLLLEDLLTSATISSKILSLSPTPFSTTLFLNALSPIQRLLLLLICLLDFCSILLGFTSVLLLSFSFLSWKVDNYIMTMWKTWREETNLKRCSLSLCEKNHWTPTLPS